MFLLSIFVWPAFQLYSDFCCILMHGIISHHVVLYSKIHVSYHLLQIIHFILFCFCFSPHLLFCHAVWSLCKSLWTICLPNVFFFFFKKHIECTKPPKNNSCTLPSSLQFKKTQLPSTCGKDYRVVLLYFIIGSFLYPRMHIYACDAVCISLPVLGHSLVNNWWW